MKKKKERNHTNQEREMEEKMLFIDNQHNFILVLSCKKIIKY